MIKTKELQYRGPESSQPGSTILLDEQSDPGWGARDMTRKMLIVSEHVRRMAKELMRESASPGFER